MIKERYLEYLALYTILFDHVSAEETTKNRPDYCNMWFADNTNATLNLTKLKNRMTELQKEFLEEYLCTDTARESN